MDQVWDKFGGQRSVKGGRFLCYKLMDTIPSDPAIKVLPDLINEMILRDQCFWRESAVCPGA